MAMPQLSGFSKTVSGNLTIEEIAIFFARSVLTVRKWFQNMPGVIRTPRGNQRPTLSVPVSVLRPWMADKGFPDGDIDELIAQHQHLVQERALAPPALQVAPAVSKSETAKNKQTVKTVKTVKNVKSAKPKVTGRRRRRG